MRQVKQETEEREQQLRQGQTEHLKQLSDQHNQELRQKEQQLR